MGCKLRKLASSARCRGGKPEELPPPAPTDPRLPLTAKQKYNMLASWKGISRAMEPTGVFMFLKLFEEHAELLSLFEKFKELKTKEEQANSLELYEHASTVMNTLDEGIKGLDNLDAFFEFLHQIGSFHRRIPGFKVEYFWSDVLERSPVVTRKMRKWELLPTITAAFIRTDAVWIGEFNTRQRGQKNSPEQDKIERPFLEAVKTTLGDRYTENVENIYNITIKFIIETLVKGFDKANTITGKQVNY